MTMERFCEHVFDRHETLWKIGGPACIVGSLIAAGIFHNEWFLAPAGLIMGLLFAMVPIAWGYSSAEWARRHLLPQRWAMGRGILPMALGLLFFQFVRLPVLTPRILFVAWTALVFVGFRWECLANRERWPQMPVEDPAETVCVDASGDSDPAY